MFCCLFQSFGSPYWLAHIPHTYLIGLDGLYLAHSILLIGCLKVLAFHKNPASGRTKHFVCLNAQQAFPPIWQAIHGHTTKSSFGGTKTQNGVKSLKANG
jgi:hypothetical protein